MKWELIILEEKILSALHSQLSFISWASQQPGALFSIPTRYLPHTTLPSLGDLQFLTWLHHCRSFPLSLVSLPSRPLLPRPTEQPYCSFSRAEGWGSTLRLGLWSEQEVLSAPSLGPTGLCSLVSSAAAPVKPGIPCTPLQGRFSPLGALFPAGISWIALPRPVNLLRLTDC